MFHSEFLASRRFSDISDYAPVLELLGKERERSWMDDVGAGVGQFQFPRSLSPGFPGQLEPCENQGGNTHQEEWRALCS